MAGVTNGASCPERGCCGTDASQAQCRRPDVELIPALQYSRAMRAPNVAFTNSFRTFIVVSRFAFCVAGIASAQWLSGRPWQAQESPRAKIAQGEYVIHEKESGGAFGPFGEEMYNFHESFTLSEGEKGRYEVEGVRSFESPRDAPHSNRFTAELDRDLAVIRVTEFTKLRWVENSGPLSCEFLATQLDCSSGGSDPKREIKVRTPLDKPYGLLWPLSPFSFGGVVRQVERDASKAAPIEMVRIEQPGMTNPVQATVLQGPLQYLGDTDFEAAGRKWRAHEFSLKVPANPEYLIWTSSKGLLLALAFEHEHPDWKSEGLRLERFESSREF